MIPTFTSRKMMALALALVPVLGACDDDDDMMTPTPDPVTFRVEVSNVSAALDVISLGVFNTAVGATDPGPIGMGSAYEGTFFAGPGQNLHFASMFVQSNDLFYSPGVDGIALFDGSGNPTEGDITSQVMLWDAGTEMNQEPGVGADQAPRQAGGNTGMADANTMVRLDDNAFGNIPDVASAIAVTLTYMGDNQFMFRLENIAADLTTSAGTAPVLLAPVIVVVGGSGLLFTAATDTGDGLETLAEDGSPADLMASLSPRVGVTSPLAPGAWVVHQANGVLFQVGSAASAGIEALAEDGNPAILGPELAANSATLSSGVFNTPVGASGAGPLLPGSSYSFEVTAEFGDRLSFATMLVQSNDLFYAPPAAGIALFSSADMPITGDITSQFSLWDAGTEVNQRPGVGADQAPRQAGANTGAAENGTVESVDDGYTYPSPVLRVTITPTS